MTKTEMHALCTSHTLVVELTIEMFQPLHSFISSLTQLLTLTCLGVGQLNWVSLLGMLHSDGVFCKDVSMCFLLVNSPI